MKTNTNPYDTNTNLMIAGRSSMDPTISGSDLRYLTLIDC